MERAFLRMGGVAKPQDSLNILFPSLRWCFPRDFGAPGVPRGSRSGHSRPGAFVSIDAQGPRRPQHTFTDGSVYTGEWAGEVKHGSGTQARADSSIHRFDSRPKGAAGACGVSVCVCAGKTWRINEMFQLFCVLDVWRRDNWLWLNIKQ